MKKLLYLLIALPLIAFMASCSDDDDHPDVKIGFSYSGATEVDGTLYSVKGDTLDIDSVFCDPVDPAKRAIIGDVTYVLDGRPLGIAPTPPFPISLLTSDIPLGDHTLRLQMSVFQEGKTASIAWLTIPVAIVEDPADIPAAAAPHSSDTPTSFSGIAHYAQ
ncbi:MAG: hypothetical protein NC342_01000 [Pseudoflavonifractor sp.]|nr:hypothetical protein [Alloprevotella sp.]MCM1116100.1 hypothetical protein [Pseudoflavonifractor sp.]